MISLNLFVIFKSSNICFWTETSNALVISSQTINLGFIIIALAIVILCSCPPENS